MLGGSSAVQDVKSNIQSCVEAARGRKLTAQQDPLLLSKLIMSVLALLRFGLQQGSSFLRFFQAAAKEIPDTPEIHHVLSKVMDPTDPTISAMSLVEREPVFMLFSLQAPGSLMRTTQRLFRLTNVMHGYYYADAPFFSEAFVSQELQPALLKLARLPLVPPSIEEGLRALHLFELGLSGTQGLPTEDSPQGAVQQASTAPSTGRSTEETSVNIREKDRLREVLTPLSLSSTIPATATVVSPDDSFSPSTAGGSLVSTARPQPVPVILKKKKKAKQAVDMSTQTVEAADSTSLLRSVGVTASPSYGHVAVQTTGTSNAASPPRSQASTSQKQQQQRRSVSPTASWEAALSARESALLARAHELDDRERALREREQLLLGIETSASPQRRAGSTHWQQLAVRTSASPRNGRCVSNAIRGVVDGSPGSPSSSVQRRHLRTVVEPESSPNPRRLETPLRTPFSTSHAAMEQATPATAHDGTPGSSLRLQNTSESGDSNLSTVFLWKLHPALNGAEIAEDQGHVCAQCGLPVSHEEPSTPTTATSSSTERTTAPPRLQALAAFREGPGTVIAKVVASATQWRQQLDTKLGSQSRRSDSDDTTGPTTPLDSHKPPPSDQQYSFRYCGAVDRTGFRVCHYTGSVFCRSCLPDGCTYVIPAKIVANWDFALYPVCSEAQVVLRKNTSTPVVHAAALATVVKARSISSVEAARGLRRQLRILHSIMGSCSDVRSTDALSSIIYSRYAALHEVYSLRDLVELRGLIISSSDVKCDGDAPSYTQTALKPFTQDGQGAALLERLKKMRDAAVIHCVRECELCKANAAKPCALCSDSKPLFLFDIQNVEACDCGEIYHKSCWEVAERRCNRCQAVSAGS
ncbi:Hypothetical protein, putative [Bodo saltans]|uniref:Rubicon Homology domain-containing protein n=1 Tax=Bodo saltans TaxID=75058 RepID=A0A0S4ILI8_BODSA|nr:Hypothetical protein, putative [Bodo saltans]|eukprot:CUE71562.1 Hypothetical protein, putative [Bodo saltans]